MNAAKLLVVLALCAVGCGAAKPPRELVDARAGYERLKQSPNAAFARMAVHDAGVDLQRAEHEYADHGSAESTKDYAYIAQRSAITAQAIADTERVRHDVLIALSDLAEARDKSMRATLDNEKSQPVSTSNRQARASSSTTMSLGGSIAFENGSTTLNAAAQRQLKDVVELLKKDGCPVRVVGYTDGGGSETSNQSVSEKRAKSVTTYLTAHGINPSRIQTEGRGATEPISTSGTGNRRVEVLVENEK